VGNIETKYRKAINEMKLEGIVSCKGVVSYLESLKYMVKSDLLLLIDAPSEEENLFFPSKLADYIGSGRPILGITPKRGASADILRDLGYPVVDPKDIEGIKEAISNSYKKYKEGFLPLEKGSRYKAENVVKELSKILERYFS
jgi:hypothetical protein